jgi:flavin-dependent thymidylate synthase
MQNVEIEVFHIARTQVDRNEVQRWLDFIGVQEYQIPDEETVSNPALLVALAAKRCYKSFEPGLNPNVTKVRKDLVDYCDNILKSGHGCFDKETEVMTERGWKAWPDVSSLDKLATRNPRGEIEYHVPSRLVHYPYKGKMIRVSSTAVDLLVTPNHRMLTVRTKTREGRKKRFFSLVPAINLLFDSHAYVKDAKWIGGLDDLPGDVAALLGFSIGDMGYEGGNILRSSLRKAREQYFLSTRAVRLGWGLDYNDGRWTLRIDPQYRALFAATYDSNKRRQIPPGFITRYSKEILQELYTGLINSDGSQDHRNGFEEYITTDLNLAEQFQQLVLHLGYSSSIAIQQRKEGDGHYGTRPVYVVSVVKRNLRPVINKSSGSQYPKMELIEDWEGEVFCAEVPNHTLYVRRNTIPVWSGNSVLEHATHSFAIENASRVFTSEMNRHRAGWAISEGSLRFIRFQPKRDESNQPIPNTGLPWWMPFSMRDNDNDDHMTKERKALTRELFKQAFTHQEEIYEKLVNLWELDNPKANFAYKKYMTSCFRRIIGLGVATGGVWTGNLRALRHVITMRAEAAAEEEICYVFSKIAKMMVAHEPHFFGDFEQTPEGFWKPKYRKV